MLATADPSSSDILPSDDISWDQEVFPSFPVSLLHLMVSDTGPVTEWGLHDRFPPTIKHWEICAIRTGDVSSRASVQTYLRPVERRFILRRRGETTEPDPACTRESLSVGSTGTEPGVLYVGRSVLLVKLNTQFLRNILTKRTVRCYYSTIHLWIRKRRPSTTKSIIIIPSYVLRQSQKNGRDVPKLSPRWLHCSNASLALYSPPVIPNMQDSIQWIAGAEDKGRYQIIDDFKTVAYSLNWTMAGLR